MWPLSTLIVEHSDFFFRGHEINGVSINKDFDTMRNPGSLPFTALRPVLTMVIHALDWLPSSSMLQTGSRRQIVACLAMLWRKRVTLN